MFNKLVLLYPTCISLLPGGSTASGVLRYVNAMYLKHRRRCFGSKEIGQNFQPEALRVPVCVSVPSGEWRDVMLCYVYCAHEMTTR